QRGIMKVPLDGGDPTTLADTVIQANGIAIDDTNIYVTKDLSIVELPLDGGTPVTLASAQGASYGVALDSDNVYWAVSDALNDGAVMKAPLRGDPTTTVAVTPEPDQVATDGRDVYWTEVADRAIAMAPIDGGAVTTIASAHIPTSIALDGQSVYWTDAGRN